MESPNFDFLEHFVTAFDPTSQAAQATVTVLVSTGTSLLASIVFLHFAFVGLKAALENDNFSGFFSGIFQSILACGMLVTLLKHYPDALGWINQGFSQIAVAVAGENGATNMVWLGFRKFMGHAFLIFSSIPGLPDVSLSDILDLGNSSKLMTTWFVDLLVSLLAMLVLAGAGILYLTIYSYSLLAFMVGAILGPVLIPWWLLTPFKFVSEGWIRFMVAAGMYRIVAIAIIAVLSPFLAKMQTAIANQAAYFAENATVADKALMQVQHLYFSVTVLSLACGIIYMLFKIPEIVSALLSGSSAGTGLRVSMPSMPKMSTTKEPPSNASNNPRPPTK